MRIIRPATIDNLDLTLTASNVPEAPPAAYSGGASYDDGDTASDLQGDGYTYKVYESLQDSNSGNALTDTIWWLYLGETYAEWNVGSTYGVNYIVISSTTHHAYQSLQASNTGHSLSDAAWWLDLGPTNRYKMFDQSNSSQTQNGDTIDVTTQVDGRADSVSVLNMVAATVQIIMRTVEDGELYNETFNLVSNSGVNNWYEYFFEPVVRKGDLTVYDLPLNADPEIQVIVSDPGDTAKVGSLVIGQSRDIGVLIHPSKIGITDYSRKETNEFGDFTIVERNFAKRATYKIVIEEDKADAIAALLALYRATAVVFVGVESITSTWIYGFYRDWEIDFADPNEAYLNMELEGLT
ncbi:hypothetical protein [Novosphingobium sp. KN65.2]|uniref:hypothetical protein n=1 Tax=Novosphingobium sp. KN65.2 TaxID=1478134 RepID=UPI0005DAFBC9|nr:hypothetical protein [Novosphingobium sp. KN65.2]CDO34992.1 conserved hypothetical protein [Novosphingobium sp. KN65.2]